MARVWHAALRLLAGAAPPSPPDERLRRPLLRSGESVPLTWQVWTITSGRGEDHSVHVPDHGTGLELGLSAWEAVRFCLVAALTWQHEGSALAVADPSSPWLMAR